MKNQKQSARACASSERGHLAAQRRAIWQTETTNNVPREQNALLVTKRPVLLIAAGLLMGIFVWAYWPTLAGLVHVWETQQDYAHGYLVVPLAAYFLWARRDRFPGVPNHYRLWPGLALLCLSALMRYVAALYYLVPLDGWSILVWVAGIVWLLGGWQWVRWSLPSIAFLFFMIPLPLPCGTVAEFAAADDRHQVKQLDVAVFWSACADRGKHDSCWATTHWKSPKLVPGSGYSSGSWHSHSHML